jgi:acyl-CoA synthetase (AMP-forming)/AMP-acid ligase II
MLLHEFLDFYARENGAVECIIQDNRTLGYTQALERVNRLANAFAEAGLGVVDRFALLSKNSIEMVVIYLAASKIGAVPVPLNWRLAPPEWAYIIDNADAVLIIAEAEFCSGIDSVRGDFPSVSRTIAVGLQHPQEGWDDFETWWKAFPAEAPASKVCEDDILYQMYTSGTTGRPKGAMLTHRSMISNAIQCMPVFSGKMRPGKRILIVMPMFHAGAASTVFGSLFAGATLVIHNEFTPERLAEALSKHRIYMANLVPAMIQAMLVQVPDLAERSYPDLELIIYGASAIAEDTLRRAMDIFQCDFYQGYGQTESSASLTFLTAQDHQRALDGHPELLLSAGRATVGTTLRIVNEEGRELPRGEVGEIIVRGPQLMKGYWKMPEANATTLVDGWLYTGDAAYMDEDGYIFIQDRIKDMVVSGGENIYPSEIENVLFDHPAIADAAVIGVPDVKFGEALLAVLVLRDSGKLEADEIISFCRRKLGGYKVPRQFTFVENLPRNASGKVLKKVLRAPYWPAGDRSIS